MNSPSAQSSFEIVSSMTRFSRLLASFPRKHTLRPFFRHAASLPKKSTSELPSSLFRYTGGRWLWNENAQLEARQVWFNIKGLKQTACRALGAEQCVSIEKLGEGNYNKAFRCTMNDGRTVVARIPHPNAGPQHLTTMSEVASMDFARTVLGLPVPKVYDWSATTQNPVQSEFIIMEEARGSQIHTVWDSLPLPRKVEIVDNIVNIEQRMLSVSFNQIGSLYFADCELYGCTPVSGSIDSHVIDAAVQARYSIGPIVRREFWEKERSQMKHHHGPWATSLQYLESIASREIEWVGEHAREHQAAFRPWQHTSRQQHSRDAHVAALQKLRSAARYMIPQDEDVVQPRFWHPDLHGGNIYVDDQGKITSIIDWQGAWTTPAFLGVNPSSLLDYNIEMLMKLPDNFKLLDEKTKDQLRYQVSQSILIHSYETKTAHKNAPMYKMMRQPHSQTLKQVEAFANATWDNYLFPLNECLLRIEREWEHFHVDASCPYSFSASEIVQHENEADDFNNSQNFWHSLGGLVADDGYTSNENFASAVQVCKELQRTALEHLSSEDRILFEATAWVPELEIH